MSKTIPDSAEKLSAVDIANFKRGARENPIFWSRFPEQPRFEGLTVLDVGSGWGSLCVDMAQAGARRVIGLDLKTPLVIFANAYVRTEFPELADRVTFEAVDLAEYDERAVFDIIVSKDTFEHVIHLDRMLQAMKARLKPGGRILTGFGPLYTTPYGDHDRRETIFRSWSFFGRGLALLPWGHLLLEPLMLTLYNRQHSQKITSLRDLGLNKHAWSDYQRAFANSGLQLVSLRTNCSTSLPSRLMSTARRGLPFLSDYLTHNVYAILQKPSA